MELSIPVPVPNSQMSFPLTPGSKKRKKRETHACSVELFHSNVFHRNRAEETLRGLRPRRTWWGQKSWIIEILVLRSDHPMNFTEQDNQLGIFTVGCYGIDITCWEWFCFSLKSKNRTTRSLPSATKGDRLHWTFVAAFFWVTCTFVTCQCLSFPLLWYE